MMSWKNGRLWPLSFQAQFRGIHFVPAGISRCSPVDGSIQPVGCFIE